MSGFCTICQEHFKGRHCPCGWTVVTLADTRTVRSPAPASEAPGGACKYPHHPLAKERGTHGHCNRNNARTRQPDPGRNMGARTRTRVRPEGCGREGQEVTALLGLDYAGVVTAHIPEPFLDALRSGHPSEVTISGLAVMVVPSRAGGVDPDVEVQAWDRVRDLHYEISADVCAANIPAGRIERAVDLPEQIAAIGWEQGVHEIVCVLGEPARPRIRHLQVVTSC